MHLCYVDESGSTGTDLDNKEQPIFVMAGLLVSDEKWRKTQRRLIEEIQRHFGAQLPLDFELHACDLLGPKGEGHFEGWSRERRNDLALSVLNLLKERKHPVLLHITHKAQMKETQEPSAKYGFSWKDPWDVGLATMFTMFEEFLRSNQTGSTSTGMVIIDHHDAYLSLVRDRSKARQSARGWRELQKVMEIGYSATSHSNPMVQFADLIAYVVRKHLEAKAGYRADWPPAAHEFFEVCHGLVWDRSRFKTLKFNKLAVPESAISYLKVTRNLTGPQLA